MADPKRPPPEAMKAGGSAGHSGNGRAQNGLHAPVSLTCLCGSQGGYLFYTREHVPVLLAATREFRY